MKGLLILNDKKFSIEIEGYEISQNVFEDTDVVFNLGKVSKETEEEIAKEFSEETKTSPIVEESHKPSSVGVLKDETKKSGKRFLLSEVNFSLFEQLPALRGKKQIKILNSIPSILDHPVERKVLITSVHNGGEEADAIINVLNELISKEAELNPLSIFIETPLTVVEDGELKFHLEEAVILYDLEDAKEVG